MAKFRKRMSIAPGVKLNLSKSGVSLTGGAKGASVNVGKNGAFLNTGIPGTGIYDRKKLGSGKGNAEGGHIAVDGVDVNGETGPASLPSIIFALLMAALFLSFGVFSVVTNSEFFGLRLIPRIFFFGFGGFSVLVGVAKISTRKPSVSADPAKTEQEAKREREREEREQKRKAEIEAIENLVKQHSAFDDGKLIHCTSRNAIALSRTGEIGIFTEDIEGIKIVNAKDIKSMKYEKEKGPASEIKECFCVLGINDFDNPLIKISLGYYYGSSYGDDPKDKYDQIKQMWTTIKGTTGKKAKESK